MRLTLFDENKPLFVALGKIHLDSKYDDSNVSKLRHYKLINSDNSLTLRGKKFLYAFTLDIPVTALEMLIISYDHRCIQTCKDLIPMTSDVFLSVFANLKISAARNNIKILVDANLLRRVFCKHYIITDYAYENLKHHNYDIMEIKDTLEC